MREEAFFDVFYECEFPPEDTVDARGFWQLIFESDVKIGEPVPEGIPWCGGDIGGGGDKNVFWVVYDNVAFVVHETQTRDTMSNVTIIEDIHETYKVPFDRFNIDDVGIGRGVVDRCREKGWPVNAVNVGLPSRQPQKYANLKAELAWAGRTWLKGGGQVHQHPQLKQFYWARYKPNTDKNLMLESKDELKKRTGKSPDHFDSFILAFYRPPLVGFM
ncbi:MAG: hypothetical protein WC483_03880 [Candidatus Paceibacterota bacterium]